MNPKTHWKMRDGNVIPIREMDDSHLLNTIEMLERRAPFVAIAEIARMPHPNGDMACDALDSEIERMSQLSDSELASELFPAYDALCDEAARRKLDY